MDVFLGFDPGGVGHFGWSICQPQAEGVGFEVIETGTANNAEAVMVEVNECLLQRDLPRHTVQAAGIDAPMFWNRSGEDRASDRVVRAYLAANGFNTEIVVPVNSMVGAALVQGPLLGHRLLCDFAIRITESHPGALNLLDDAMNGLIVGQHLFGNAHERDATFAAYAAWHIGADGWQDLFDREPRPILPLGTPISYWMPI